MLKSHKESVALRATLSFFRHTTRKGIFLFKLLFFSAIFAFLLPERAISKAIFSDIILNITASAAYFTHLYFGVYMVQEIYKNSLSLFIPVGQIAVGELSLENPAKHLIKTGRRLFVSAKKEYDFGETAEMLAENQTETKQREHLNEIAGWHFQCAVERLETAISNFKRAEQCAISAKYRKYARIQRKKCSRTLRNYRNRKAVKTDFFSFGSFSVSLRGLFR